MYQNPSRLFPPSAYQYQEGVELLREQLRTQIEATEQLQAKIQEQLYVLSQGQEQTEGHVQDLRNTLQGLQMWSDAFDRKQDQIKDHIRGLQDTLERIQALSGGFGEKLENIAGCFAGLYQKDFPIDVRFERAYYAAFPVCTSQEVPDFQADFLSLVDGLDKESIETVVLALQRLKLIQESPAPAMALYSDEEKQIMRELIEHFFSNVMKLSDTCYFYRGFLLPVNHFEACVFRDKCCVPFLERPERLADRDIIDAGAFIGDSALIFSPITTGKVYAFEPIPSNYELMLKTIELNGLENVVPCDLALGEKTGTIQISPSIDSNGSCSTQFENRAFTYKKTIEVNVITLDEFVKEHELRIGLIKADIEGAEQLLLRGAMETIKSQKPALLISIYHNASDFFKIKPILEALGLGYKFKIRHPVGVSFMTEMLLIAEVR